MGDGNRVPIDSGLGTPSPWDETAVSIDVDGITLALKPILRSGLPVTTDDAGPLLDLRSVYARSIHPYDPVSRCAALNQLLVRLLAGLGEEDPDAEALRILFAVALGTGGTLLTRRQEKAAVCLSYEIGHFRKRVQPQLIKLFAETIYQDLLLYKRRVRRAAEAEEPTGDTPTITENDFTHEEELISRIWQHVYGLRAEVIASGRLHGLSGYESQVEDHRQAGDRHSADLERLIAEYTGTYGQTLIRHGDAEYRAEAVSRLARHQG